MGVFDEYGRFRKGTTEAKTKGQWGFKV